MTEFDESQKRFIEDKGKFVLHYASGRRMGKALEQAKYLAELAKRFTNIEIVVVPHPQFARMEAALKFYADADTWVQTPEFQVPLIAEDRGTKARAALRDE